jgi:pilus assembly protein FimV
MLRDLPDDEDDEDHTLVLGRGGSGEVDEMQTKLDLAQAYMDMGDSEGARNLLGEVMAEGGDAQKDLAREMLARLS